MIAAHFLQFIPNNITILENFSQILIVIQFFYNCNIELNKVIFINFYI